MLERRSYSFLPEHWGHVYAREACGAVLDWGFANIPDTDRIVAITQAANLRSVRLSCGNRRQSDADLTA
ncbi:GNAT family N-acetyltransferase [Nonomuraea turcica]|uniref:GNAT family N-acetyltransferase n=1 Tax=Nonomuraea sp. G32 TaxID=3067274 RepID=UPI0035300B59